MRTRACKWRSLTGNPVVRHRRGGTECLYEPAGSGNASEGVGNNRTRALRGAGGPQVDQNLVCSGRRPIERPFHVRFAPVSGNRGFYISRFTLSNRLEVDDPNGRGGQGGVDRIQ